MKKVLMRIDGSKAHQNRKYDNNQSGITVQITSRIPGFLSQIMMTHLPLRIYFMARIPKAAMFQVLADTMEQTYISECTHKKQSQMSKL
jgi:hypothetical protein